jgi:hypothetical protein
MMEYNTKKKRLPLPEYGRAVQRMVDHALTIENREERQQCAETIVCIMDGMFPVAKESGEIRPKLWDHLAIMSDFKLDIDYPCEVIRKETFNEPPARIPYLKGEVKNKHYGRFVEEMIAIACNMEDGEERNKLIELITIQMKKDYLAWNKDTVDNKQIFEDLREYSKGKIDIQEGYIKGYQQNNNQARNNQKRKKVFKKKY